MKKTIIITTGLYPSEGIFSLIKYISVALISNKDFHKKYNLKILLFNENLTKKVKKIIYDLYLTIKNIFLIEKNRIHKFSYSAKKFTNDNYNLSKYIEFFINEDDYNKFDPHLIFPMQINTKKDILSVGYIYDLQHKDLPYLFDKKEIKKRNNLFRKILNDNQKVIVNSKFVKNGLIKKYKANSKKIIQLPFIPYIFDNIRFSTKNIEKKYDISNNYFIISNNFWKHKNHETAFKAFKIFLLKHPNFQLICTGNPYDSRFPNYFKNLSKKYSDLIKKNRIKILNSIPRSDQLNLMKGAKAVVQPTLYEGGPGGFSSYEALSIGKKLLISNIPINKEIKSPNVHFFNPNSPTELSKLFSKVINIKKNSKKNTFYKKISKKNKKFFGKFLLKMIDLV